MYSVVWSAVERSFLQGHTLSSVPAAHGPKAAGAAPELRWPGPRGGNGNIPLRPSYQCCVMNKESNSICNIICCAGPACWCSSDLTRVPGDRSQARQDPAPQPSERPGRAVHSAPYSLSQLPGLPFSFPSSYLSSVCVLFPVSALFPIYSDPFPAEGSSRDTLRQDRPFI